jgi:hypothetical protein
VRSPGCTIILELHLFLFQLQVTFHFSLFHLCTDKQPTQAVARINAIQQDQHKQQIQRNIHDSTGNVLNAQDEQLPHPALYGSIRRQSHPSKHVVTDQVQRLSRHSIPAGHSLHSCHVTAGVGYSIPGYLHRVMHKLQ